MIPVQPGTATGDPVLTALGGLGGPVDCTGLRSLPLEGPHVLWLVVAGALDLFAVDAAQQGHWHYLGRLEPGALLLGPVEGPRHTLVGRPLQGCFLRRVRCASCTGHPTRTRRRTATAGRSRARTAPATTPRNSPSACSSTPSRSVSGAASGCSTRPR